MNGSPSYMIYCACGEVAASYTGSSADALCDLMNRGWRFPNSGGICPKCADQKRQAAAAKDDAHA